MVEGYGLILTGLLPLVFHVIAAYNCWRLSWIQGGFFTWRVGWAILGLSSVIYGLGRLEAVLSISAGAQVNWYRFMSATLGAFCTMFFTTAMRQVFRDGHNGGAPEARRPTTGHGC